MPALTPEQRAKEQAILYTTLADLGIVLLTLVFAIITLSLTLIGETVRMVLMMASTSIRSSSCARCTGTSFASSGSGSARWSRPATW